MILTQRVHPFPFRTRKLSSAVPTILAWRRAGKIGHCRHNSYSKIGLAVSSYSSLAQSVEHLTVNQGVTGSSPVGGAKTKTESKRTPFLFCFSLGLRFSDTLVQLVALQGRIFPQGSSRLSAAKPCHMVQVRSPVLFLFTA